MVRINLPVSFYPTEIILQAGRANRTGRRPRYAVLVRTHDHLGFNEQSHVSATSAVGVASWSRR